MDISNRAALLETMYKSANPARGAGKATSETVKELSQPFLSLEERQERLRAIQNSLRGADGPLTYTEEQKKKLASYKDLVDNWDSYKEYVNPQLQALGDLVAEKTILPIIKAIKGGEKGAVEHGIPVPKKRDTAKAEADIKATGSTIHDLRCFKQTYAALQNNTFHKIASSKMAREDISSAFQTEFDKSYDIFIKNAKDYGDLDHETYAQFHELAVAHHILTQEGFVKDAKVIDNFVIKNAGFWSTVGDGLSDGLSYAWDAAKGVASKAIEYGGKAISFVADVAVGAVKAVGKAAWGVLKGLKYIVTKLPFIGIIFSAPFFLKNLIESYQNGKRILLEQPLEKYGWNPYIVITPAGLGHVRSTFIKAVDKHKKDPDALKEILTIFRTIGAFWIDLLFMITNGFMLFLDLCALIGFIAGFFTAGAGWLVAVGAYGGSFLLALGIGALELGAEYFKDEMWDKDCLYLLDEAKKEIKILLSEGTPAKRSKTTVVNPYEESSSDVIETSEDPIPIAA